MSRTNEEVSRLARSLYLGLCEVKWTYESITEFGKAVYSRTEVANLPQGSILSLAKVATSIAPSLGVDFAEKTTLPKLVRSLYEALVNAGWEYASIVDLGKSIYTGQELSNLGMDPVKCLVRTAAALSTAYPPKEVSKPEPAATPAIEASAPATVKPSVSEEKTEEVVVPEPKKNGSKKNGHRKQEDQAEVAPEAAPEASEISK